MKFPVLAVLLGLLLPGCAAERDAQTGKQVGPPLAMIGSWANPHAGDPNLAAVALISGTADPFDQWGYVHTRPSGIWYAFWDGRVHQLQYRGDGTVWDDFWWPAKARLTPGSAGWAGFDFTYGSDPTFIRHRDPRFAPAPDKPLSHS